MDFTCRMALEAGTTTSTPLRSKRTSSTTCRMASEAGTARGTTRRSRSTSSTTCRMASEAGTGASCWWVVGLALLHLDLVVGCGACMVALGVLGTGWGSWVSLQCTLPSTVCTDTHTKVNGTNNWWVQQHSAKLSSHGVSWHTIG